MGQYLVGFLGLPQNAMLRAGLFITMLNALQVPAVLQTKYGENGTGLSSHLGDWKGLEKPSQVFGPRAFLQLRLETDASPT